MLKLTPRNLTRAILVLSLTAVSSPTLRAGEGVVDWNHPNDSRVLRNIYVGGMYRMIGYHRQLSSFYPEHANTATRFSVGDGYRIPTLEMSIGGSPFPNSWFSSQIYMMPLYAGAGVESTGEVSLGMGVSISGGAQTPIGYINADVGGLSWKRLSPLTMWSNEGFNRVSIFDRSPWEQTGSANARYNEFFQRGGISQDTRWGRRAFQGLYLTINGMPKDFSGVLIYGKTDNNGGTDSYQRTNMPDQAYGGQIKKGKDFYYAFNTFNTIGYTDSINGKTFGFNVATGEFRQKIGSVILHGEMGVGSYHSPSYQQKWSEGIVLSSHFKIKQIPVMAQAYRLGVNFISGNAMFANTSIAQANQNGFNLAQSSNINPFQSPLSGVGQMTNNRHGISINAEHKIKDFYVSLGYGNSAEIEKITPGLSFSHDINGLQFSRLSLFQRDLGPYNRVHSYWMGYYEELPITDTLDGAPINDKFFNVFELHSKYHFNVFKRDGYIFYLTKMHSVQTKFSPFNKFNDEAYIRKYNHEIDLYYAIAKKVALAGYVGYERIIGNDKTQLNTYNRNMVTDPASLKPIDQTGKAIGAGIDIDIAKDMGLHLRHRWFHFEDANFADDVYGGQETTIELKFTF